MAMVDIPLKPVITPQQAYEMLQEWFNLAKAAKAAKAAEMPLRRMLADYYFPGAPTGASRLDLGGGYCLKITIPDVTRKVDAELLATNEKALRKIKVDVDALINFKPSLVKKEYDKLTDAQKLMVDSILEIDDKSSPTLAIEEHDAEKEARHAAHVTAAKANAAPAVEEADAEPTPPKRRGRPRKAASETTAPAKKTPGRRKAK
jgi:hypothetical protein